MRALLAVACRPFAAHSVRRAACTGYFALGVANHSVKLTETKLGTTSPPKSWGIDSDTLLEQYELNGAMRPKHADWLTQIDAAVPVSRRQLRWLAESRGQQPATQGKEND